MEVIPQKPSGNFRSNHVVVEVEGHLGESDYWPLESRNRTKRQGIKNVC
jgi:hypothetical protein